MPTEVANNAYTNSLHIPPSGVVTNLMQRDRLVNKALSINKQCVGILTPSVFSDLGVVNKPSTNLYWRMLFMKIPVIEPNSVDSNVFYVSGLPLSSIAVVTLTYDVMDFHVLVLTVLARHAHVKAMQVPPINSPDPIAYYNSITPVLDLSSFPADAFCRKAYTLPQQIRQKITIHAPLLGATPELFGYRAYSPGKHVLVYEVLVKVTQHGNDSYFLYGARADKGKTDVAVIGRFPADFQPETGPIQPLVQGWLNIDAPPVPASTRPWGFKPERTDPLIPKPVQQRILNSWAGYGEAVILGSRPSQVYYGSEGDQMLPWVECVVRVAKPKDQRDYLHAVGLDNERKHATILLVGEMQQGWESVRYSRQARGYEKGNRRIRRKKHEID